MHIYASRLVYLHVLLYNVNNTHLSFSYFSFFAFFLIFQIKKEHIILLMFNMVI